MRAEPDNFRDGPVQTVFSSSHERRMHELEQELEFARKQVEVERLKAQAVTSHIASENQHLRQNPQPAASRTVGTARRNPGWQLAGHMIGRLSSLILGLFSCFTFVIILLLVWAYWPELSALLV